MLQLPWWTLLLIACAALCVGVGVGAFAMHRRMRVHIREAALSKLSASSPDRPHPRAAIVLNPTKCDPVAFAQMARTLSRQHGWGEPVLLETTAEDPGVQMGFDALSAGVDLVVAAGGDGTVRAVAQALAHTQTPVGIVPLGTGNLLARNLGIVLDRKESALRIAMWGHDKRIDLGTVILSEDGPEHIFTVMTGIGFDAEVMSNTDSGLKSRFGWLAYVKSGSERLSGTRFTVSIAADDDRQHKVQARSVVVGNCGRVQGGVELLPQASITDGYLDTLVISPKNLAQWAVVVAGILSRARKQPHAWTTQGQSFTLRTSTDVEYQIDGDTGGTTSFAKMSVLPQALTVRTPTQEQARAIRNQSWPLS